MDERRFWKRVAKTDTCWNWIGHVTNKGYGRMHTTSPEKSYFAHRYAYELFIGPIPKGMVIDHLCRNTICVNPAHLEAVTDRINVLRGVGLAAQNAKKTHCIHGHLFSPDNFYTKPFQVTRKRLCKACNKIRWEKRTAMRHALKDLTPDIVGA